MKNLRYIIATVFVVAIGAGMFFSCQKEEITSKISSLNNSETKLHQKQFKTHTQIINRIYIDPETGETYFVWGEIEVADNFNYIVGGYINIQKESSEGDPNPPIIIIHFPLNTTTPGTLGEFTVSILIGNYSLEGLPTENTNLYLDIMVDAFNN
ncbi:MAG: hypothetical protein PHC83_06515 [Bacteroidales bacterium]|jgi:hypothetical protein|nr:hypothetical protein [Bacteroidales bacterium]MDD4210020.1 hypothetical protein [Bacteroidales bacterium]MDY0016017.1 hypothetical protein [Bacteroidales bacterium]